MIWKMAAKRTRQWSHLLRQGIEEYRKDKSQDSQPDRATRRC